MEDKDEEIEVGQFLSERSTEDIVIVKAAMAQSVDLLKRLIHEVVQQMLESGEICLFVDDEE